MDLFDIIDWPDKFEWMSLEYRSILSFMTLVLLTCLIIGLFGLFVFSFFYGYWKYSVGFLAGIILAGIFRFCRGIYRDYRKAHPRLPKPTVSVLEKKTCLFTE